MVLFLFHSKINSLIEQCHTFFYKRSSFNERNRLDKWKTLLIIITGKLHNYRKHPFVVVFQNGPFKKGVLKNFAIFIGEHLCWSLFLIEFQPFRPANLFKKILQRRCFLVNIVEFLSTVFLIEHLWWLLLNYSASSSTSWQISPRAADFGTFNQAEFGGEPSFISWSHVSQLKGKVSVLMAVSDCYSIRYITERFGTFISWSEEGGVVDIRSKRPH